jgi:hypothetical protein
MCWLAAFVPQTAGHNPISLYNSPTHEYAVGKIILQQWGRNLPIIA